MLCFVAQCVTTGLPAQARGPSLSKEQRSRRLASPIGSDTCHTTAGFVRIFLRHPCLFGLCVPLFANICTDCRRPFLDCRGVQGLGDYARLRQPPHPSRCVAKSKCTLGIQAVQLMNTW